jgi:anion-transporting  ArsA/GET3 family ATPase
LESGPERPLLARRLVIVTGKGGTGKTSVAAALAWLGAERGLRVLVAEMGPDEHVPRLLEPGATPVGYAGRELRPGLRAMRIDPYSAISEYLTLQVGGRALIDRVLRYKPFRQLLDAAPGWRELITLGKLWHLEQMKQASGRPLYDLLVVDAPATGHGITFLDVPRVVVSAVRAGPLHRHSTWVEAMITDAAHTVVLPVALAEELPARETSELVTRLREQVGVDVDRVVVNAVMPAPFGAGFERLDETLARLDPELRLPGLPAPRVLAACAGHLRSRFELNRRYVEEIGNRTGLPVVPLPYLAGGVGGPEDLAVLARHLEAHEPARAA